MQVIAILLFVGLIILFTKNIINISAKIDNKLDAFKRKVLFEDDILINNRNYSIKVILYRKLTLSKMTQIIIGTQGALPNIYLDSTHNMASLYNEKHLKVKKLQKHSLEGDFDKYFTAYTSEEMKIESLQFLTPDVLQFFKDKYFKFDILLYGGTFDMRKAGDVDIEEIKNNYKYLLGKIDRIYKYWKTQDKINSIKNELVS